MQLCYCLKRSAPVPVSDASKPSSLPSGSASSMGHSGVATQEQQQGALSHHPEASAGRAPVVSQDPGPAVGNPVAPVSLTSGCTRAASPSAGAGSTTSCEQPPCSDAVAVPLASAEELAAASIPVPRSFTRVPCAEYPPPPTMDLERGTDCVCLLLHVAHTGVPPLLVKLLESRQVEAACMCCAYVLLLGATQSHAVRC